MLDMNGVGLRVIDDGDAWREFYFNMHWTMSYQGFFFQNVQNFMNGSYSCKIGFYPHMVCTRCDLTDQKGRHKDNPLKVFKPQGASLKIKKK